MRHVSATQQRRESDKQPRLRAHALRQGIEGLERDDAGVGHRHGIASEIGEAIESLTPETPPGDILSIIRAIDALDGALVRLGLAAAPAVADYVAA